MDSFVPAENVTSELPTTTNIYVVIYVSVVCTIIMPLGLFGNSLVLIVIIKQVSMQNITNFFIASLAISDMLILLLTVPTTVFFHLLTPFHGTAALCRFAAGFSILFPVYLSSWNLVAIAIDRCFIILNPLKRRMQKTTCFILISLIWIMAAILPIPHITNLGLIQTNEGVYCNELDPKWVSSV
ncbi:hypothetical protein Ciccas_004544 [Cichlidogyrus casuarinus]|uniref:G-protein coupled receptors family 1 profile domain-containing protein n=1 Tax=Cichlidogyrus casuarinus TaxID=1844966 RepID=A0ABD2QB95_9PLAT